MHTREIRERERDRERETEGQRERERERDRDRGEGEKQTVGERRSQERRVKKAERVEMKTLSLASLSKLANRWEI